MIVPQPDSEYVWLNHSIADDKTKVPLDDLSPEIKTPILVAPKDVLQKMLLYLRVCMKHNFDSSVVLIGATIMAFHYQHIVTKYGGCPIPLAVGPGKTTSISTALSLFGCNESAYYVKGTNVFFLERSATSTLRMASMTPRPAGQEPRPTDWTCIMQRSRQMP